MPGVASLKGTCLSLWKPLAYQRGVKGLGQPVSWDVPGLTPPGGVHVCVCACARPGQPGWAPEEGWWELSIHHWLPLRLINSAVSGTQQAYGLLSLLLFYSLELKSHFLSPRGKPIFHMKPQLISVCIRMCVCVCVCVCVCWTRSTAAQAASCLHFSSSCKVILPQTQLPLVKEARSTWNGC